MTARASARPVVVLRLRSALRLTREVYRLYRTWWWLVAVAAVAIVWPRSDVLHDPAGGRWLLILGSGLLILVHRHRQDRRFLRIIGVAGWRVRLPEYLACASPFVLLLVGRSRADMAAALVGVAVILGSWPARWRVRGSWQRWKPVLSLPCSPLAFEWRSGVRRLIGYIGLIYVTAVPPGAPHLWRPVLILGLAAMSCTFYVDSEGWPLVHGTGLTPRRFLVAKVRGALQSWAWVVAPLVVLQLVFSPDGILISGMAVAVGGVGVVGAVLTKYGGHREGRRDDTRIMIVTLFLVASLLVFPVTVYALIRSWRRAESRLEMYLHAYGS